MSGRYAAPDVTLRAAVAAIGGGSVRAGAGRSLTVKVEPLPGSLRTLMLPPMSRTARRQTDRPSPDTLPSCLVVK